MRGREGPGGRGSGLITWLPQLRPGGVGLRGVAEAQLSPAVTGTRCAALFSHEITAVCLWGRF